MSRDTNHPRALRVGIVGPCPRPHGGVTRLIENHLRYWEDLPVETWFIPEKVSANPDIYPQTHLVAELRHYSLSEGLGAFFRVGFGFGLCRWATLKGLLALDILVRKSIKKYHFDIIWVHHSFASGLIAISEARRAGIPVVVSAYGETWFAERQAVRWRRAIYYSIRKADWVVSTSEHCRRGAIQSGAASSSVSVIYAGIDTERFRPGINDEGFRRQYDIPKQAIVVSILGLILRRKIDIFLKALQLILGDPRIYVLIGGVGEDRNYLDQAVRALRSDRIRTLGFVPDKSLPEFYAATDILVVAPSTKVECMGQSMKEAMSCGRAVVGARIGGVPEALEDGVCGLMFNADSPVDLARTVKELIVKPNFRNVLGANARLVAEGRFNARVSAQQMYELLWKQYEIYSKKISNLS